MILSKCGAAFHCNGGCDGEWVGVRCNRSERIPYLLKTESVHLVR